MFTSFFLRFTFPFTISRYIDEWMVGRALPVLDILDIKNHKKTPTTESGMYMLTKSFDHFQWGTCIKLDVGELHV